MTDEQLQARLSRLEATHARIEAAQETLEAEMVVTYENMAKLQTQLRVISEGMGVLGGLEH